MSDKQSFPFVGTQQFFVYIAGRRPEIVIAGIVFLYQMDIYLVVHHHVALQVFLHQGNEQILEHIGRGLGPLKHRVHIADDDLGRSILEHFVVEIHHPVVEHRLGSAHQRIVFEHHIIKIMLYEVVAPLVGSQRVTVGRHHRGLFVLAAKHHFGQKHFWMLLYQRHLHAVELQQFAVFILGKRCRVHRVVMLADIFRILPVDDMELKEKLVLATVFHLHVRCPVVLISLKGEERLLAVNHKLDISPFRVGEKIKPVGKGVGSARKDKTPFLVHKCSVNHLIAFCKVMPHIHHRILSVLDGKGDFILGFLTCLCRHGH